LPSTFQKMSIKKKKKRRAKRLHQKNFLDGGDPTKKTRCIDVQGVWGIRKSTVEENWRGNNREGKGRNSYLLGQGTTAIKGSTSQKQGCVSRPGAGLGKWTGTKKREVGGKGRSGIRSTRNESLPKGQKVLLGLGGEKGRGDEMWGAPAAKLKGWSLC